MNKENEFYQNEVSTGIMDSMQKSTYSSRFYRTQKKTYLQNKILPSRYEKAAITIQRHWRFRQVMKRRVCQRIIDQMSAINQCYALENRMLAKLVEQYESIVEYKEKMMRMRIKDSLVDFEAIVSEAKKQCVMTSFKLEKKNPKKELLAELINQKSEQKEMNLMLNRQKLIVEQDFDDEHKHHDTLLQEYKKLNLQRLQLTQQKHQLAHRNAEKLLETSKFGSRHQSISNNSSGRGKTFIIDFFEASQNSE